MVDVAVTADDDLDSGRIPGGAGSQCPGGSRRCRMAGGAPGRPAIPASAQNPCWASRASDCAFPQRPGRQHRPRAPSRPPPSAACPGLWRSYSVMSHRATIRSSACCGSRPALASLRNAAAPALGWFSIRMVTAGRAHLMLLLSAARRRVLRAPRLVSAHLQRRPGRHRRRGCGRCAAPVMAGDVLSPDALGSAVADRPDAVRWCGASFDHQVGRGWGLRSLAQVTDGPDGPGAGWES